MTRVILLSASPLRDLLKRSNLWSGRLIFTSDNRLFYSTSFGIVYVSPPLSPLLSCEGASIQLVDEKLVVSWVHTPDRVILQEINEAEKAILMLFS